MVPVAGWGGVVGCVTPCWQIVGMAGTGPGKYFGKGLSLAQLFKMFPDNADGNVGFREWAIAVCMMVVNLKGVSSMQLSRDLGVTQKTAWFMDQRIRCSDLRPAGRAAHSP